jgi:hypothetical protein
VYQSFRTSVAARKSNYVGTLEDLLPEERKSHHSVCRAQEHMILLPEERKF